MAEYSRPNFRDHTTLLLYKNACFSELHLHCRLLYVYRKVYSYFNDVKKHKNDIN